MNYNDDMTMEELENLPPSDKSFSFITRKLTLHELYKLDIDELYPINEDGDEVAYYIKEGDDTFTYEQAYQIKSACHKYYDEDLVTWDDLIYICDFMKTPDEIHEYIANEEDKNFYQQKLEYFKEMEQENRERYEGLY